MKNLTQYEQEKRKQYWQRIKRLNTSQGLTKAERKELEWRTAVVMELDRKIRKV